MELILPAILFLGLPFLILFVFKSNVGVMFLAACAGIVLLNSLDPNVVSTAGALVPSEGEAYVRLAVVLITMSIAGIIFRKSTSGSALLLNSLAAVFLGVTLWLTLPSATGVSWLLESTETSAWQEIDNYKTLIIAAGFGLSLLAILNVHKRPSHKKSKH